MYGKKPASQGRRPQYGDPIFPAWLVFLTGVALVFAAYYLWIGVQDFVASGGLGVAEATQRIVVLDTATAEQIEAERARLTPRPTWTPLPECQEFVVIVESAIIRAAPSTASPVITTLPEGEIVCVIERLADNRDWYLIDRNPRTTRTIETGYMFYNIIQAANPTPTPSDTFTPAPSVTPMPSSTLIPSATLMPSPTGATAIPTPQETTPELIPPGTVPPELLPTAPIQGA